MPDHNESRRRERGAFKVLQWFKRLLQGKQNSELPQAAVPVTSPLPLPAGYERFVDGLGHTLIVHAAGTCGRATACPIHAPSAHSMRDFKLYWRNDSKLFERLCPHGIGHPDPDSLGYIAMILDDDAMRIASIHGCDGCCHTDVKA